jgi:hypothetical protein
MWGRRTREDQDNRMKRKLFTVVSALSLLLCLASVGLWVRSYIGDGGGWEWTVMGKTYHFGMSEGTASADFRPSTLSPLSITTAHDGLGIFFVSGRMGSSAWFHLGMPLWVPATLFSLLPTTWGVLSYSRRRPRAGCCPICGYDLTGNASGVCPECGRSVSKTRGLETGNLKD